MRKNWVKKVLVVGIIMLFVGAGVVPITSSIADNMTNNSTKTMFSEWRYPPDIIVPDDYPTIQKAIDNASLGSYIGVRNGTYNEQISINKNDLTLEGDLAAQTIIHGENTNNLITIRALNVTITDFNFIFNASGSVFFSVIDISGQYCKILNNNITGHGQPFNGIYVYMSDYITISGNKIWSDSNNITEKMVDGISLVRCNKLNIKFNKIYNCYGGIYLASCLGPKFSSDFSGIICNKITQNNVGIFLRGSLVQIRQNEISKNSMGGIDSEGLSLPYIIKNSIVNTQ